MSFFKKIFFKYNNDGLDGIVFSLLRFFKVKVPYANLLEKRRLYISQNIKKKVKNRVIRGPYHGTYFSGESMWGEVHMGSKYLGFYEEQVQKKIISIFQF